MRIVRSSSVATTGGTSLNTFTLLPRTISFLANSKCLSHKKLDILVNNLGAWGTPADGFAVLTDKDGEKNLQTNLLAPVGLDRGFLPQMVKQKNGVEVLNELSFGPVVLTAPQF
ncbi:SDR family NAD(P)-dependent oxidoreductase [Chitinophaga filiformis]|uniref:SDR family NAD(P)-dependent oxidoreductase n=1 Tax=Chitinophaga filiformis TaxID=104663 RepID=UPI001F1C38BC|nr:SDR family NAD(P)-dependent oxidoreductase [Chitinophaga filiformis]MCF6404477.1 SDR family NAD(P)-dependent oxidoreductase [Chitinophaga filiformis]